MLFIPWVIFLSIGIFLLAEKPQEEEKTPEKELGNAIAKYLAKSEKNGSQQ